MAVSQARIIESLEQVCSNLNPDEFIYSFLDAYGFPKSTITRLRKGGDNRNVGEGDDIGLKKKLYFRTTPAGTDLDAELNALKASDVIARNDIRFVIVTDFSDLVAFDTKAEERLETSLSMLDKQYAFFLPLVGYEKAIMYSEHPADVKASEKMGQLFDLIRERNDLSKPEDIHALNVFLTRLLFCFYAEDTGIFEAGQMTSAIQPTTQDDGTDVDQFFTDLFTVLNLEQDDPKRKAMPAHLQAFRYVNGGLFRDDEPIPAFGRKARRILLDCGSLNWSEINPDIFGSMFQAVIDEEQRGNLGQHYTSVSNIMKVIQPLFLDKLYAELEKSRKNENKLKALLVRLQSLRIFDPACGSGNFLIIAYKELRKLEMEVIDALNAVSGQAEMYYSGIRLSQFYGIEIDDFAHEVAVLSLWLAEHQMNMAFKAKFGYAEAALPLRDSGNIVCGNALRLDWEEVCPPVDASGNSYEVYICGNPPFSGWKNRVTSSRDDMAYVFSDFKTWKVLDLVASWFWLSAKFLSRHKNSRSAFVSTNSICQGEQAATLWEPILSMGLSIEFCYQTFSWKNNARDNAAVHVVVIGITTDLSSPRRILTPKKDDYLVSNVSNISPYLVEGGNVVVKSARKPLRDVLEMVDGNNYTKSLPLTLSTFEKQEILSLDPEVDIWLRPLLGASEYMKGTERWCLWLEGVSIEEIKKHPVVWKRVEETRLERLGSSKKETREKAALTPQLFPEIRQPKSGSYVLVPRVTSERRQYVPVSIYDHKTITTNKNIMIPDGGAFECGILMSSIHLDWMRSVGGRMKSDYAYSAGMVYNTFPWPEVNDQQRKQIEALAEEILLIREDYPDKSLADLYDPKKMPDPLREAHKALDQAVERLYRAKPFRDASERLEHLFALYEKLVADEKAKAPAKKKTTRSK